MKFRIAPSILSADFGRLGEEVRAVIAAGADLIHFDVMDNHYVPNLTIGPLVCEGVRPHASVPIDVHLMVKPVDRIIPEFAKAGAGIISFHPEASEHVDRTIDLIREHGCKPGLVFNPATPLGFLDYTLHKLDLVLLMSVNPGFGGQKFIPSVLDKIREVRRRVDLQVANAGREVWVEVDGGAFRLRVYQKGMSRAKAQSNSYRLGFILAMCASVQRLAAEKEAEMQQAVSSRALVVSKASAIEAHYGAAHYGKPKASTIVVGSAFAEGRAAGAKVDVGRRGIVSTAGTTRRLT